METNVSRRGFVGAVGAMGAMGAAMLTAPGAAEALEMRAVAAFEPDREGFSNEEIDAALLNQTMVTEDYTFPSGKTIPAVYINLRNKLMRLGTGLGAQVEENERAWDFIMMLYTEEDAARILDMPLYQVFSPRDYAILSGCSIDEAEEILADMADRTLIIERTRGGDKFYELMNMEFGWWEWNLERWDDEGFIANHETAFAFNNGLSNAFFLEPYLITMPPTADVIEGGEFLPYTSWEDVIRSHEIMCTVPCACRTAGLKRGDRSEENIKQYNCDTCFCFGDVAEMMIEKGVGRQLTREEAIENIKSNIAIGTVTQALWAKDQMVICQCDGEQCTNLGVYRNIGAFVPGLTSRASLYTRAYDKETCIGCGTCIDRCNLAALSLDEEGKIAVTEACVRCGQCAYVCPAQAVKLVPMEGEYPMPEDDFMEKSRRLARVHYVDGDIVDFLGQPSIDKALAEGRITEDQIGHSDAFASAFAKADAAAASPSHGGIDVREYEAELKAQLA